MINCHRKTHGFDALFKSTVYLAFKDSNQKRTKIQKIQKGANSEDKHIEAIMRQEEQMLIMLNRLPDEAK